MSAVRRSSPVLSILAAILGCGIVPPAGLAQCQASQRPVRVSDMIAMTEIDSPRPESSAEPDVIGLFSPDGRRFAVVLHRGDLDHNTNVYTLLVFSTRKAFQSPQPKAVVRMSSDSNLPGIADLRWLKDSRTLLFIGEKPGVPAQIYSLDVVDGTVRRLTRQPRSVVAYDTSDDGRTMVFETDPRPQEMVENPRTLRNGFVVNGEALTSILLSGSSTPDATAFASRDLFLMKGTERVRKIALQDGVWPQLTLSASPDGRYALVEAVARQVPAEWKQYGHGVLQEYLKARQRPGALSSVETYLLLDTDNGRVQSLLGAPKEWAHDGYLWVDGGRSLVLSHSYLPIEGVSADEKRSREQHPSVVEIRLPSRTIVPIDREAWTASAWNDAKGQLTLSDSGGSAGGRRVYQRRGDSWYLLPAGSAATTAPRPAVTITQGLNTPPRLWLSDPASGRRVMLLDPNPQFSQLCFGPETVITWKGSDGRLDTGGLYLPTDYVSGRQYPLVIQTHAFNPDRFWIDGPWHSAYAAQALAAKGMVVLQTGYDQVGRSTPVEAPRAMAVLDGAIDDLSRQGIVDPDRVGIIGFSRTVFHVSYALTHSKYHFAAATLADGVDDGYFQTIAFGMTVAPDAIAVNGGFPWNPDLEKWLGGSPLFNVGSVTAPVRLEAYGMDSVLALWGWYALLSERNMPVDMIVLPHGTHLLVKPRERMVSQQGNADWFSFWLNGQQDPSPAKREQYERWIRLRSLLRQSPAENHRALDR